MHTAWQQEACYDQCSINIPNTDMVAATDFTGLVSSRRSDKSSLFEVFYVELHAAPMIQECPLNIECRVLQTVELPTNSFFIAEIITIDCDGSVMTDSKPDIEKIKAFALTMPDSSGI